MSRKYTSEDYPILKIDLAADLPPPPARRGNEESVMQRALLKWWKENYANLGAPEWALFSIPNGGNGSAKRGSIMKAEGQRKGAPDLFLACSRQGAHSLFIELKRPQGVISVEQNEFHLMLREQGFRVAVIRSLADAINLITIYLTK